MVIDTVKSLSQVLMCVLVSVILGGCGTFDDRLSSGRALSAQSQEGTSKAWLHATVGVASLETALALWQDTFGFDVKLGSGEQARELERLWDLPKGAISRHAFIGQSDLDRAKLLLVEYLNPGAPVRQNAKLQDSLPKNIDVYVDQLDVRLKTLKERGYTFRSADPQSFVTDGITVREIHMPAHDETNIVILERSELPVSYTDNGFFGIGMIIVTVPDIDLEQRFLQNLLDLNLATDIQLAGPELEAVTGLPPGTQWLIKILGEPDFFGGQIELVEYRGVEGENLYARAEPGALGLTSVAYEVDELDEIADYLTGINHPHRRTSDISLANSCYDAILLRTPAGMPVHLLEQSNACRLF